MSAITLAHDQGIRELNSGALHRYLAEAVWYPTALLPDAGVKWSEVDNNTAIATLTISGITVSLEFRFNHAGEVTGIYLITISCNKLPKGSLKQSKLTRTAKSTPSLCC